MHWTFSLDLLGSIIGDSLVADIVLNETFHSAPMKIVSLELPEVTQACTQPHITCGLDGECSRIKYGPRE
jgi:hypothetical protein